MSDAEKALHDVLQTIAREQGYNDYQTVIKPFSTGGANFTSNLYHIVLSESGKDDLRLFAKVACFSEAMRDQMPLNIYDTETFFYTKLLTRYQDFEERNRVPQQHRLSTVKFYGSCQEHLKEVLVLEDLTSKGFHLHDRLKSYDWEYASKSVLELAKLHALSIAYFEDNPTQVRTLSERLTITSVLISMQQMIQSMFDVALAVCKDENRIKLQSFLHSVGDQNIDNFFKPRRLPVICHGDYRPSNLMHRREKTGEIKVLPLDYQTLRISSPVCDLMYFIFCGSDQEFRKNHYHQLLDVYYKELCNSLTRLGLDPQKVYSREDYDFELKELQSFGLLMGIMMTPVLTVEAENAPDMSESAGFEEFAVKPNDIAGVRINGVIDDFVELGILK